LTEILAVFYIGGIIAFHRITVSINLTANRPFDCLAKLKYLRMTLTDQNCALKEIRSTRIPGNTWYILSQEFSPSRFPV